MKTVIPKNRKYFLFSISSCSAPLCEPLIGLPQVTRGGSNSAKPLAVSGAPVEKPGDDRLPTDLREGDNFIYNDRKACVMEFFPSCLVPGTLIMEASHYVCQGERMVFCLQLAESRHFTAPKEEYGKPNNA